MADALKAFEEELQSKNFKGYWQTVQGDVYREPVPSFEPCQWKGKDLFAAMEKAGDVVGLDLSFRRVIPKAVIRACERSRSRTARK